MYFRVFSVVGPHDHTGILPLIIGVVAVLGLLVISFLANMIM